MTGLAAMTGLGLVAKRTRLGYAEHPTVITHHPLYLKAETTVGPHESVYLYGSLDLSAIRAGDALPLEQDAFLLLAYNQKIGVVDLDRMVLALERTKVYWMDWCARTTPTRRYPDQVERSAMVLKLLSYHLYSVRCDFFESSN